MQVLIVGGFGFVGGRIAEYLLNAGHQITLGSRDPRNVPKCLMQAKIAKIDWSNPSNIRSICKDFDVIIHAAGMNAVDCASNPVAALDFNGIATSNLVAAAVQANVKKFIYISTAHVYGNPLAGHITENTFAENSHPYATSHLVGENAVIEANLGRGLIGIVLRLSNAFGVPISKEVNCWMLLINDLCRQAVENKKLILRSSGLQFRNFIGLSEVCRVVNFFSGSDVESKHSGVFNVGSNYSKKVLDMAELIQNRCYIVLGFKPELLYEIYEPADSIVPLLYSIDRIKKLGLDANDAEHINEIDALLKFCQLSFSKSAL